MAPLSLSLPEVRKARQPSQAPPRPLEEGEAMTSVDDYWYCFECYGIGYFPKDWDEVDDTECPCCGEYGVADHHGDSTYVPPCVDRFQPWIDDKWTKRPNPNATFTEADIEAMGARS